jgi:CHAT domain-containing protein
VFSIERKLKSRWLWSFELLLILLILCNSLHFTVTGARAFGQSPPPLELSQGSASALLPVGKSNELRLEAGGSQVFTLALAHAQYVRIVLSRATAALSLSVLSPAGIKESEIVCLRSGSFPLSFSSNVTGQYQIEVRNHDAKMTSRCEMQIETIRAYETTDKDQLLADQCFANAEGLRAQGDKKGLLEAIKQYDQAVAYWQKASDFRWQAIALKSAAEAQAILGNNETALAQSKQALKLSEATGDIRSQIETLNQIAALYIDLGDQATAFSLAERARSLSAETDDLWGASWALNNIALAAYMKGDMESAMRGFVEAMQVSTRCEDRWAQGQILLNIGYTHFGLGEFARALESYQQAVEIDRIVQDRRAEARALTAIGGASTLLGEKQRALDSHQEALRLFEKIGDPYGQAVTLNGIGYSYEDLGEQQDALDFYQRALTLYRALRNRAFESLTLGYIARVYRALGNLPMALNYNNQKREVSRDLGNRRMEAQTFHTSGEIYRAQGNLTQAMESFRLGLAIAEEVRDVWLQGTLLNEIGGVYAKLRENHKAHVYFMKALPLLRSSGDRDGEARTLTNLAEADCALGNLTEALSQVRDSIHVLESLRARVVNPQQRSSYFASAQRALKLNIDILMRMYERNPSGQSNSEAFAISERARARTLIETLAEAHASIREGVNPSLLAQEQTLQRKLDAEAERQMRILNANHTDEKVREMDRQIRATTVELEKVESEIRQTSSRYATLMQPEPLSAAAIQQQVLDQESVLLEYSLGQERSYLWAITKDTLASFVLPGRTRIESAVSAFLASATARQRKSRNPEEYYAQVAAADRQIGRQSSELAELLLRPVAPIIRKRRLIIVPDGILQRLPFAALPDPSSTASNQGKVVASAIPMVVDHEIIYLPSASTEYVLRNELAKRPSPLQMAAVLADPVFDRNDVRVKAHTRNTASAAVTSANRQLARSLRDIGEPSEGVWIQRLPFTRREAAQIKSLVPSDQYIAALDFDANFETVASEAFQRSRYVHFATHGLLDDQHPELSGIVLSLVNERGEPRNGFLRLQDTYNLKLSADLVVLSACQTGLGKDASGEGLVGLGRGFMYAGAAGVLASLWSVDDLATADLMKSLYTNLLQKKLKPAAALRAAQLEMWKQKKTAPLFFWAAFILQGDWR